MIMIIQAMIKISNTINTDTFSIIYDNVRSAYNLTLVGSKNSYDCCCNTSRIMRRGGGEETKGQYTFIRGHGWARQLCGVQR